MTNASTEMVVELHDQNCRFVLFSDYSDWYPDLIDTPVITSGEESGFLSLQAHN